MKTAFQLVKERIDQIKAKQALQPKVFKVAEEKGRQVFTAWCSTQDLTPIFDESPYGAFDAVADDCYYEIKYKEGHKYESIKYLIEKEGLMLEETKFNRLKQIWNVDQSKTFYFWTAFEDVILIHKLNFTKQYNQKVYNCPNSTVNYTGMKEKQILLIPFEEMELVAK